MVPFTNACDTERLAKLLTDSLPELEEARATDHIGRCASCRAALEELAAAKSWWQDAGDLLQGSQWSGDTLTLSSRDFLSSDCDSAASARSDSAVTSLDFLELSDDPALLGRLGRYEILSLLGAGGFGIVLKGYDAELNRFVAVKVLAPHLAHNAAARRRFAREAQAAAAVVHPHVVAIHAIEATGQLPYLVMPFVAGESLQERLEKTGPLEVKEILRIGLQVAQGLAAAHAQGVVHRDVKPANILLEPGVDRVLLTDFGLARVMDDASLTRSMVIAGTPQYMSPEQAQGSAIDQRTDLFSLGSVLYAMCTGHPPFRAETLMGLLRRISDSRPRPVRQINPDIPGWLEAIIEKLHARDPDDRFASAEELAELLERCLAHVQQPVQIDLPLSLRVTDARRRIGSSPRLGWMVLGTVLSLAAVVTAVLMGPPPATPDGGSPASRSETHQDDQSTEASSGSPRQPAAAAGDVPDWSDDTARELEAIDAVLSDLEQQ